MTNQTILDKYHQIIAEEVNVKEVTLLPDSLEVTKTYVPLGKALSASFWKDTGQIIAAAKQWNIKTWDKWDIVVFNNWQERTLHEDQYEVRYSGLEGDNQIVEDGVIVELDLEITPELKAEWIAREISRFLNQMRKEADYQVSDRVACFWSSDDENMKAVMEIYSDFLQTEALLSSVSNEQQSWDLKNTFTLDESTIEFSLKR